MLLVLGGGWKRLFKSDWNGKEGRKESCSSKREREGESKDGRLVVLSDLGQDEINCLARLQAEIFRTPHAN